MEGIKLIRRLARVAPLSSFLLDSDVPRKNIDDLSDAEINEHIDKCKYASLEIVIDIDHHRLRDDLSPDILLQDRYKNPNVVSFRADLQDLKQKVVSSTRSSKCTASTTCESAMHRSSPTLCLVIL